jgi:ribosomal protein L37AE/L43A
MPDGLTGFRQLGVKMIGKSTEQNWFGDCPFCGKGGHFYIHTASRLWDCKACGKKGNYQTFLEQTVEANTARLAKNKAIRQSLRGLRGINNQSIEKWRIGWNGTIFTIPVYNADGVLIDVRRYNEKIHTQSTKGCRLGLMGLPHLQKNGPIYLCEGEWDAMVMQQCLATLGRDGSVLALPGANSFKQEWHRFFAGRHVISLMDNDDAGKLADNRIASSLRNVASKTQFVHWVETLPTGYDFRDLYLKRKSGALRIALRMLQDIPRPHPGAGEGVTVDGAKQENRITVTSVEELAALTGSGIPHMRVRKRFAKWMNLGDPDVLDVMYGTILANRIPGDPLWTMLVAPSGGGKTECIMSLDGAPLVVSITSLTPHSLLSGSSNFNGSDPSLLPKLNGKVLTIKDLTTLLSMNQVARDEIFGILRDAYDGKTEKAFGTGLIRSYKCQFGILAGVTGVIDTLPQIHVSLGERFIKYRVRQYGGVQSTDAVSRVFDNIGHEIQMREELCAASKEVLNYKTDRVPRISPRAKRKLIGMAQLVALLRTPVVRDRYTSDVSYRPSPEVGTRLAKQLTKLALGIAIYRHRPALNKDILRIVARVARDTVPSNNEIAVRQLFLRRKEAETFTTKELVGWTRLPSATLTRILEDLALLRIVKRSQEGYTVSWSLTKSMALLMEDIEIYLEEERWRKGSKSHHEAPPLKRRSADSNSSTSTRRS